MTISEAPAASKAVRRRPDRKPLMRRMMLAVRRLILDLRVAYFRHLGMTIGRDTQISLKARIDKTNPRGIHIGDETLIAFDATVLAHDLVRVGHYDTYIGDRCFIAARSVILPGIHIGDGCIIAAGAVVTKDVPSGSIVAGNPGTIIKSGIKTLKWGVLEEAYRAALEIAV